MYAKKIKQKGGTKGANVLTVKNSLELHEFFLKFSYRDLIICPKSKYYDYRKKKVYTAQEQEILNKLYNVNHAIEMFCPIVCSGNRGDGSSYRNKCRFFGGYGKKKENVWNFHKPENFVFCSKQKSGKVYTQQVTSCCERRNFAGAIARNSNLIHNFGSACLNHTPLKECLKCRYKTKDGCSFKIGCEKGKNYIIFTQCKTGNCEKCKNNIDYLITQNKKRKN